MVYGLGFKVVLCSNLPVDALGFSFACLCIRKFDDDLLPCGFLLCGATLNPKTPNTLQA